MFESWLLLYVLVLHSKAEKHSIRAVPSVISSSFPVQEAPKFWGKTLSWWKNIILNLLQQRNEVYTMWGSVLWHILFLCYHLQISHWLQCRDCSSILLNMAALAGETNMQTEISCACCWCVPTEQNKPFCRKAQFYPVYIYNRPLGTVYLYTKITRTWSLLSFSSTN